MSDKEDCSPWEQQRTFGAGVKRRRIDFVAAAAAPTQAIQLARRTTPSISPGDRYLNIVFKNGASTEDHDSTSTEVFKPGRSATQLQPDLKGPFCEICNLPIDAIGDPTSTVSTNHESTIAHMVCLTHSHPPSHLDRSRQGLKYLSSYGWDPDSRQGLGATGKGVRAPIKAKVKNDTVGLGAKTKGNKKPPGAKVERMDAKQVRKMDMEDRRKRERLREMFYRNDDVEKYLGGG
ncbi:hypothetical protein HO173_010875 [Letharia columbiana]|uniref:G-patch domain-containing protein n=1 Tax=Letharia columbiana TaxID=112416 RepID=A0A8H6FM21_9LECA|nr:uncharacterized protein HO173_010875 [Letharia columbiana]KAF6230967.1 hypothetical protein HO173_010875 [Letharia columbiana]